MTDINDLWLNPNQHITISPLPDADRKAKLLGFDGYGIFKILEPEKTIDFEYLAHFDNWRKLGDEKTNVLLFVYAFLFGHHKVFEVAGYDTEYFGNILLKAIHSGNGAYIHNHLSKRGYYESSYYKKSINKI